MSDVNQLEIWGASLAEVTALYGMRILGAVLILAVGWTAAGWLAGWLRRALGRLPKLDPTLTPLLVTIVRYAVMAMTVLAVLAQFGVAITSFIAVLGAAGLAVGLALQGTLTNVASGVMLLVLRPFKVGDHIESGPVNGIVDEIGLFATELHTPDNRYVSVPNKLLFEGVVVNNTRLATRQGNVVLALAHDADIEQALRIVEEILRAEARILPQPAAAVFVQGLGERSVNLQALFWSRLADLGPLSWSVNREIKRRFAAARIEFAASAPVRQIVLAGA